MEGERRSTLRSTTSSRPRNRAVMEASPHPLSPAPGGGREQSQLPCGPAPDGTGSWLGPPGGVGRAGGADPDLPRCSPLLPPSTFCGLPLPPSLG